MTKVLLTKVLSLRLLMVRLYWLRVRFMIIRFRSGPPHVLVQADVLLLPCNAVYDNILCALRLGTL